MAKWEARQARTLIHISRDGAPICSISISANHVHEDYRGCKAEYIARQKAAAQFIIDSCNAAERAAKAS